jgi:CubicO group peptidase (beta-lactamase class C family)
MFAQDIEGWLKEGLSYIERWLAFQLRMSEQPGCSIAVQRDGVVVFETAFGVANQMTKEPLTPRHLFRVASHSKAFTAAAVMVLFEQGKLRLDDRVGQHVKNLPPDLGNATIAQLMTHSAGLTANADTQDYWNDLIPWPDEAELRRQLALPLVLEPGEQHKYSNVGYGLLGLLIEAITAQDYISWMMENLIPRAGLTETFPDYQNQRCNPFASGHAAKQPIGRFVIPGANQTRAFAPATGFVSTASDLVRFFAQLAPNAANSFLSVRSRREMTRRHWRGTPSADENYYGFGISIGSMENNDYFGHRGSFQGYQSRTCVIPDLDLAVSVITNAIDGPASDWLSAIVHILKHFANAGPTADSLRCWQGRWWNLWATVDLIPLGDIVVYASSDSLTPFAEPEEIEVVTPTTGRFKRSEAPALFGEMVERTLDEHGNCLAIRVGGDEFLTEDAHRERLKSTYHLGRNAAG